MLLGKSGAWGKIINEKPEAKSRDTAMLKRNWNTVLGGFVSGEHTVLHMEPKPDGGEGGQSRIRRDEGGGRGRFGNEYTICRPGHVLGQQDSRPSSHRSKDKSHL
jgi:hypothetical protein